MTNLRLAQLIPAFVPAFTLPSSGVWGKDIELKAGNKVLVRAPSGKGKSSLLAYIFGTRTCTQGKVVYDETDKTQTSLTQWSLRRQQKISMVFQDLRLFDRLTVKENLEVKQQLAPVTSNEKAEWMLEQLGMADFLNRSCNQLSFGQQQRVAIVRSLLQPFEWLLLDEPFSHLDEANSHLAFELIKQRCEEQGAGLIITSLGADHQQSFDLYLEL